MHVGLNFFADCLQTLSLSAADNNKERFKPVKGKMQFYDKDRQFNPFFYILYRVCACAHPL